MRCGFIIGILFLSAWQALAAEPQRSEAPTGVQWKGAGYRYHQHGWTVVHLEGKPYERGYQHGSLLSKEIVNYLQCFAAQLGDQAPSEAWQHTRTLVNAVFLRKFDREYIEEMQGIADGASEANARFDGRKIDLLDIAALNLWAEIESLDSALEATPNGLEGIRFSREQAKTPVPTPMDHCSAFVATGPATADGKVVFGHITMFSLYPSNFYNIWLDIKPANGYRVVMQSFPGGIQSGMDYYMNEKGILLTETTIRQTKFNVEGMTLASRVRKAMQYGENLDQVVSILKYQNNGLYTNEWLMADIKTNEIALFELGTKSTKLMRSSRGEWFGGTEGFYWSCNNTKDLEVRLDAMASLQERPQNVAWRPSERDKAWLKFYAKYRGKISVEQAREAFTTAPLAAYSSLDVKITTSSLASELKSHALFGPPLGNVWEPTESEKKKYPEIRPLLPNPWTLLQTNPPSRTVAKAADFRAESLERNVEEKAPAWFGTLLPKTEEEIWFTGAFAEYERLFSLEAGLKKQGELTHADHERLAVARYPYRSALAAKPRSGSAKKPFDLEHDQWVRAEVARGIFTLDAFRLEIGDEKFSQLMSEFGQQFAGKSVTATQFEQFVEARNLPQGLPCWKRCVGQTAISPMPFAVTVEKMTNPSNKSSYRLTGRLDLSREVSWTARIIELTIETNDTGRTVQVSIDDQGQFTTTCETKPSRLLLNKYNRTPTLSGPLVSTTSFTEDLSHCVIVYGTLDYGDIQKAAAERLHQQIRRAMLNYRVTVLSDREFENGNRSTNEHVLLIGTPKTNRLAKKWESAFPLQFDDGQVQWQKSLYTQPRTGFAAAVPRPDAPGYSVLMFGGLSGEATYQMIGSLGRGMRPSQLVIVPDGGRAQYHVHASEWVGTLKTVEATDARPVNSRSK